MCRQVCSNGGKGKYMWSQVPGPVSLKAWQCQRHLASSTAMRVRPFLSSMSREELEVLLDGRGAHSWRAKPQFKHEETHEAQHQ